jgi:hypothetical protein
LSRKIKDFYRQKFKNKVQKRPKYLNTGNMEDKALQNIAIIASSRKIKCSFPDDAIGIFIGTILPGAL